MFTVPLEVMQSDKFDHPVKVILNMDMTYYHILSHPEYNRTEAAIHSDLEESILVMSPVVVAFYTLLFLATQLMITKICNQLLLRPRVDHVDVSVKSRSEQLRIRGRSEQLRIRGRSEQLRIRGRSEQLRVKLSGMGVKGEKDMTEWDVAWQMVRHVLKQGLRVQFHTLTQVFFLIFESAVGILIVFLLNFMSAELVTYKKPVLLDTLEQVWNGRDQFNISFIEASGAPGVFKHSRQGSLKQKAMD